MSKNLVFERSYNAPIAKVWKAITDKNQMKEWYFDLKEFRAEPGFEFSFYGGSEQKQYLHKCRVIEANPVTKLSYTWEYEGYPGSSTVTWELEPTSKTTTKLTLTHTGLDSFATDNPDFAVTSFTEGWTYITGTSLTNFVETGSISKSVKIMAEISKVWEVLHDPDHKWATAFGGGSFVKTDWKQGSLITWTDLNGDIGARGIIITSKTNSKLEFRYFDETEPPTAQKAGEKPSAIPAEKSGQKLGKGLHNEPAEVLGEYTESLTLTQSAGGEVQLDIKAGPLAKKYLESHGEMWSKAVELIKSYSENLDK